MDVFFSSYSSGFDTQTRHQKRKQTTLIVYHLRITVNKQCTKCHETSAADSSKSVLAKIVE